MTDSQASETEKKSQQEIAALDVEIFRQDAIKRVELTGQFAMAAWKALTISNGGAIIAMFTLVGSGAFEVRAERIWFAFAAFIFGLVLAIGSNLAGYFTQGSYLTLSLIQLWNAQDRMHGLPGTRDEKPENRRGTIIEWIAVAAATLSLIAFGVGSYSALSAALIKDNGTSAPQHP